MAFNAVLGHQIGEEKLVVDFSHPPVMLSMKVKTGQGVLPAGLIVARDSNDDIVPYDPAGTAPVNEPVGVLYTRCDTENESIAVVVVHGVVVKDSLLVGENAPSDSDLKALMDKGIYPRVGVKL